MDITELKPTPPSVDVRSLSLGLLALLASLYALHWAKELLVPVLLGLAFSYALSPLVNALERLHLPRVLGAALLIAGITGGLGWSVYALSDDAYALIESLPAATQKVHDAVRARGPQGESALQKVQKAATELEQAAQEGSTPAATTRGVTRVRIERPQFDLKDYVWSGSLGALAALAQALVVIFITFFLLASGNTFRRKLVRIAGPDFAAKRITVQALDEITDQIQRYLLVQLCTSVLVGLVIWAAFSALRLEHAAVWGAAAFVLDFIPYLGASVLTAGSAFFAFVQFGNLELPLLVGGTALLAHTLSGNLLTPWLSSRASRMNAVAIFIGVLAFGWLWGPWGLLLGVPILTTVKAVCDRVEHLKPIGELLGD